MRIDDSHMKPYVCKACGPGVEYAKRLKDGGVVIRTCKLCKSKSQKEWGRRRLSGLCGNASTLNLSQSTSIIKLYKAGISIKKVSGLLSIGVSAIKGCLYKNKVPRKWSSSGGVFKCDYSQHGYVHLTLPLSDPFHKMGRITGGGVRSKVAEHRYIMAKNIGRPLERWEVVHHKNHIRDDNRIENLELMASSIEHLGETLAHNEFMRMKKRIEELEATVKLLTGERQ